jgi:hypothetical protein
MTIPQVTDALKGIRANLAQAGQLSEDAKIEALRQSLITLTSVMDDVYQHAQEEIPSNGTDKDV